MVLPARILEGSVLKSVLFNPGSAKEGVSDIISLADHKIGLGYSNMELTGIFMLLMVRRQFGVGKHKALLGGRGKDHCNLERRFQ